MPDTSGLPSALGIEAVHWVAQEGGTFTVRVRGRWRRRRPAPGGQALLMVEAGGARQRFPAIQEPRGMGGAAPGTMGGAAPGTMGGAASGTWELSFAVPAAFAPPRAERLWLQMGAVVAPLAPAPGGEPEAGRPVGEAARPGSLALQGARRRAAEAETAAQEVNLWISQLEASLDEARKEPERLRLSLEERERALRLAEQRAYAEQERRLELEEELADARRALDAVIDEAADIDEYEERIAELEDELEQARRAADETEYALRAAIAARRPSEPRGRERPAARGSPRLDPARITQELEVLGRSRPAAPLRPPVPVPDPAIDRALVLAERALVARRRARAAVNVIAPPATDPRLASTLAALRDEMGELRAGFERERAARTAAEQRAIELEERLREQIGRSARAFRAIGALRAQVEDVRALAEHNAGPSAAREAPPSVAREPPPHDAREPPHDAREPPPAAAAGDLDPARLAAALSRLREETPQPSSRAGATAPAGPWLERAFAALLRRDPGAAGELLLSLLVLQGVAGSKAIAYDLVLSEAAVVRVTAAGGASEVVLASAPRAGPATDFQLRGDLPSVVRLLLAGPLRRHIPVGIARLRGDRAAIEPLRALIRMRLSLAELALAGVRLGPLLALKLAAAMIDPRLTVEHRFTLAHRSAADAAPGPFLHVVAGSAAAWERLPEAGAGRATVTCPPESLLAVLAGIDVPDAAVDGGAGALELVRGWLDGAQRA